ncbi:MAG: malate dehydrogenase [Alicyclobacillaceae bacterium]|uniref:malate dehydrogenase n=1 Tax=Alicyclobacillus sp. SP_1 TaxID=2942475 RepID=UPI00215845A1|nr:malate dehydrogenase [Alicyclobacillus sp. SP_1]MCY0887254.1 malate dehydrogenase [Alicyclobacillaceae bacterium]MCY0896817.1 malate dehydrogenase [Alicyclobacillaceae bacterium]
MMLNRRKVSIIGAGLTGATTAFMIASKEMADVVLLDIPQMENPTKGKGLDMQEAMPVIGSDVTVVGTSQYEDTKDSDVVIITAGLPRKPGMSRDDLVSTNAGIVQSVTEQVMKYSPNAILVILSNPVDAMTYVAYQTAGIPKQRVIGQAGVLDTARFNTFVALELGVSVEDVHGFVIGVHGDDMVPLVRYSNVAGVPLQKLLPKERIDAIVERTAKGGGEIGGLLGNASAYYAPAASLAEMTESILKDKRRLLPSIALLEGEFGFHDLFLGVPTILGANGIEKIIEVELDEAEKEWLNRSAESVRRVVAMVPKG